MLLKFKEYQSVNNPKANLISWEPLCGFETFNLLNIHITYTHDS